MLVLQIAAGIVLAAGVLMVLAALLDAAGSTHQGDMFTPAQRAEIEERLRRYESGELLRASDIFGWRR